MTSCLNARKITQIALTRGRADPPLPLGITHSSSSGLLFQSLMGLVCPLRCHFQPKKKTSGQVTNFDLCDNDRAASRKKIHPKKYL